jgi:hypothetical membrane protein
VRGGRTLHPRLKELAQGPWPLLAGFLALCAAITAGTLASGKPLVVTPISLLDGLPASWAYELILLHMALLTGTCWWRWRRSLVAHRALGAALAAATVLFLLLIGMPFPSHPWHEQAAILAMACISAHALVVAWRFRHRVLWPAATLGAAALLLVLTARLPLVGLGEHLLLLSALPEILLCYGSGRAPAARSPEKPPELRAGLAFLCERRAVLAGVAWMLFVVTAARVFLVIEGKVQAVTAVALPCWLAGALAPFCAWCFPHRFLLRAAGIVTGMAAAAAVGGLHSWITTGVLLAFGLPLLGGIHLIQQQVEDFA